MSMVGFSMFSSLFAIVFIGVLVGIAVVVIRGFMRWGTNNASPVLTVEAKCVAKRTSHSSGGFDHNTDMHHSGTSHYFATFEVESGDRMEFAVADREYGLLAEGDRGMLTFQGTRYHSFARDRVAKNVSGGENNSN